jgi:hypothetical protein
VGDHGGAEGGDGVHHGRVGGVETGQLFQPFVDRLQGVDIGRPANFRVQAVEFVKVGIALGGVQCWFSQAHAMFTELSSMET